MGTTRSTVKTPEERESHRGRHGNAARDTRGHAGTARIAKRGARGHGKCREGGLRDTMGIAENIWGKARELCFTNTTWGHGKVHGDSRIPGVDKTKDEAAAGDTRGHGGKQETRGKRRGYEGE